MRDKALDPLTYVIAFALCGAGSVVTGVAVLVGLGWALVCAGSFLLAAAGYITRGMTNG
jgi:hypothetical protein